VRWPKTSLQPSTRQPSGLPAHCLSCHFGLVAGSWPNWLGSPQGFTDQTAFQPIMCGSNYHRILTSRRCLSVEASPCTASQGSCSGAPSAPRTCRSGAMAGGPRGGQSQEHLGTISSGHDITTGPDSTSSATGTRRRRCLP
jgi:hypothetical protein